MSKTYPLIAYKTYVRPNPTVPGKVSVVTATYNRPDTLKEAIKCVQAQTYQNWEQIIISDGPDGRVPALVAALGDPRIRCSYTRRFPTIGFFQKNYALRYTTGEFVFYLDDDNLIYPHCLETMVRGFDTPEIGYVICPIRYACKRDGNPNEVMIKDPKPGFRFREIDQLNYMVRRRLVQRVWGLEMNYASDFTLIHKIAGMSRGNYLDEIIGFHA